MNVMIPFMIALLDIVAIVVLFVLWFSLKNYFILYLLVCAFIVYLNIRYCQLVKSKEEE